MTIFRLKRILRELKCKWFGHKWVKHSGKNGWGLGPRVIRQSSIFNRKGGRKRNLIVEQHRYNHYVCTRCGLTVKKLRKGERLYEGN